MMHLKTAIYIFLRRAFSPKGKTICKLNYLKMSRHKGMSQKSFLMFLTLGLNPLPRS